MMGLLFANWIGLIWACWAEFGLAQLGLALIYLFYRNTKYKFLAQPCLRLTLLVPLRRAAADATLAADIAPTAPLLFQSEVLASPSLSLSLFPLIFVKIHRLLVL